MSYGAAPPPGASSGALRQRLAAATPPERLLLTAGIVLLADGFLPWYTRLMGWSSGALAVVAILLGALAGAFAVARVTGANLQLGVPDRTVVLALGGGAGAFTLLRMATAFRCADFGLYLALVCSAGMIYAGFEWGKAGAGGLQVAGPPSAWKFDLNAAVRKAVAPGPIIGAVSAGAFMWIPTHSAGSVIATALSVFALLAALRIGDPLLAPLWRPIARIPWAGRKALGIGVPVLYGITRFGPCAAGSEIATARSSILLSVLAAYVFLRPTQVR